MNFAVIIYGPPGSGKGTQANLLQDHYNLIHFDIGKYLEEYIFDKKNINNPQITEAINAFKKGALIDPTLVFKIIESKTYQIEKSGSGLVFSGSARTLEEAEKLFPILDKLYNKKVFIFVLNIKPETSIDRNSKRVICRECGKIIINHLLKKSKFHLNYCPYCGGKFRTRVLDKPNIIRDRHKEYKNRTMPIIPYLKSKGYKVYTIGAENPPFKVFKKIKRIIDNNIK